jgi:hypothetical protein
VDIIVFCWVFIILGFFFFSFFKWYCVKQLVKLKFGCGLVLVRA